MDRINPAGALDAIAQEISRIGPLAAGKCAPEVVQRIRDIEERCNSYKSKALSIISAQLSYISDVAAELAATATVEEVAEGLRLISSVARYQVDVRSEFERERHKLS